MHCCTVVPLHFEALGEHCTQAPSRQSGVSSTHLTPGTQLPATSHVSGTPPLHFFAVGTQTPVHLAFAHPNWHASTSCQAPVRSHDCTALPLGVHSTALG